MEPLIKYQCNACGKKYFTEKEAINCHPDINKIYICQICNRYLDNYKAAEHCKHKS